MNTAIISKLTHNDTRIKVSTMLSTSTKIFYWHIPPHSPLSEALLHEEATRHFLRSIGLTAPYRLVSGYIEVGSMVHIPLLDSGLLVENMDKEQTTGMEPGDNKQQPEGLTNNTAVEAEKKETV